MTKAVIIFFISLGVYLVGLIGYVIFKKIKAKKHFEKRVKEEEQNQEGINHEEEHQD